MLEYIIDFLVSWFVYPNNSFASLLLALGLALAFGAVWLLCYWPPVFKKHWLWAVFIGSALLSLIAVTFIQLPLQTWAGQALGYFWGEQVVAGWIFLTGIPQVLLSGLVQEGSKLVPVVIWWWRKDRNIDLKLGLAIGAVAGAGLGVFEAMWVHGSVFASGWSWDMVQTSGLMALEPFWVRFSTVGFHIAASALAGYGLARGWGWQFYLLASLLHGLLNYGAVLFRSGLFTTAQLEIYLAALAALMTAGALSLRWKKLAEEGEA